MEENKIKDEDKYYAARIKTLVEKALMSKLPFYKAAYENINENSSSLLVNLKGTDNCLNEMIIDELLKPKNFKRLLDHTSSDEKTEYKKERSGYFDSKNDAFTEKRLAICIYNYGVETILGTPVHYETPINKENIGAIDLVYKTDKHINLIELKSGNSNECLLRAILELITYYKCLNISKFRKDFDLSDKLSFQFIILLQEETQAFKDAENLKKGKLPNLKKFLNFVSQELEHIPIKVYSINKIEKQDIVICGEKKKTLQGIDFKTSIKDMEIEY